MSKYYFSYRDYLKQVFPFRVHKIGLDAGFTCPNRDGSVAYGGCVYCENRSFSPNSKGSKRSVSEQILSGMEFYRSHFKADKFIAYFQAYTNTYGPVNLLDDLYREALSFDDVVGLSIGTRPDCLPDEVIDLLASYSKKTHLWVEIGLQSMYEETLTWMNRGHSFEQFIDAITRVKLKGLRVCVHIILGLPGETHDMIMQTADVLAGLDIDGLKVHHLYVAENTMLEKMYAKGGINLISLDEYIHLVCDFLERIQPCVAIQRLTGELTGDYLIAPKWGVSKKVILTAIDNEFERRNSFQGKHCKSDRDTTLISLTAKEGSL